MKQFVVKWDENLLSFRGKFFKGQSLRKEKLDGAVARWARGKLFFPFPVCVPTQGMDNAAKYHAKRRQGQEGITMIFHRDKY